MTQSASSPLNASQEDILLALCGEEDLRMADGQAVRIVPCKDTAQLCERMQQAAAALIDPAMIGDAKKLREALEQQPGWSELPLVVLGDVPGCLEGIANVTRLERAVSPQALRVAIQAALRDRRRQLTARDLLAEQDRLAGESRESENSFRKLADSMAQMIWVTRPDGYHEYYNRRWYEFTGVPEGSTDGEEWNGMFHPDDQPRAWARWRHSLATGEPYEIEYRLRRADGQYCWVLGRALPSLDEAGNIVKWYGTCTDIEKQKQTELSLTEARRQADEANHAKTEFLANMSHEIRTPMNAIIGLTSLLAASKPLTSRQAEFVRTLQGSADGLLSLINDLLDIAKIEARSVELERIPFCLTQIVQEVISMMAVRAKEKGLGFSFNGECARHRVYIGDPARLRQIILNLCSNAVKFTDKGGVNISVECDRIRDGEEVVRLTVADTGIGIAAANMATIFEKFVQADSSISRKYGGTGLGLAITKTLIEIMGGAVTVSSEVGKGSQFTVTLPLGLASEEQAREVIAEALPETGGQAHPARRRILLVEDYAPNVMVAGAFLDQFGYVYDIATNGAEAVRMTGGSRYDAVLMDVQMHGMNGLEATKLIRQRESRQGGERLPIIGMTAHALTGDRERCLGAGMDEYLSKPFDPEALKKALSTLIEQGAQTEA